MKSVVRDGSSLHIMCREMPFVVICCLIHVLLLDHDWDFEKSSLS